MLNQWIDSYHFVYKLGKTYSPEREYFVGKPMRRRIRFLFDRAVIVLGLFVMCLVVKAGMFGVALLTWG